MKAIFVLIIFYPVVCFTQIDISEANSIWEHNSDTVSKKKNLCIPVSYDTIFLINSDSLIYAEVYTKKQGQEKTLYGEIKLFRTKTNTNKQVYHNVYHCKYKYLNAFAKAIQVKIPENFQTGTVIQYDSNGYPLFKVNLLNGYLHGEWKQFYPDGTVMIIGKYKKGARTGKWTFYYDNGNVLKTGRYFPRVYIYTINFNIQTKEVESIYSYGSKGNLLKEMDFESSRKDMKRKNLKTGFLFYPELFNFRIGKWKIYSYSGEFLGSKWYWMFPLELDEEFDLLPCSQN